MSITNNAADSQLKISELDDEPLPPMPCGECGLDCALLDSNEESFRDEGFCKSCHNRFFEPASGFYED